MWACGDCSTSLDRDNRRQNPHGAPSGCAPFGVTQAGREHPGQPALMRLAVGATGRLRKDCSRYHTNAGRASGKCGSSPRTAWLKAGDGPGSVARTAPPQCQPVDDLRQRADDPTVTERTGCRSLDRHAVSRLKHRLFSFHLSVEPLLPPTPRRARSGRDSRRTPSRVRGRLFPLRLPEVPDRTAWFRGIERGSRACDLRGRLA